MTGTVSNRLLTIIAISAALNTGCGLFQSPYSDRPTYASGEKGTVAFGSITNRDASDCQDGKGNETGCKFLGKVILTKPTDNVSFQIFQGDNKRAGPARLNTQPPEISGLAAV